MLLLLAIALTVVAGPLGRPAAASFSDTASRVTAISTITVAAPGGITTTTTCDGQWAYTRVSWTASPTLRIAAYDVRIRYGTAPAQLIGSPAASTTFVDVKMERVLVIDNVITYTVTTRTNYGWWTASAPTPRVTCPA